MRRDDSMLRWAELVTARSSHSAGEVRRIGRASELIKRNTAPLSRKELSESSDNQSRFVGRSRQCASARDKKKGAHPSPPTPRNAFACGTLQSAPPAPSPRADAELEGRERNNLDEGQRAECSMWSSQHPCPPLLLAVRAGSRPRRRKNFNVAVPVTCVAGTFIAFAGRALRSASRIP